MNRMQQGKPVPELLCPAGSPLALDAAIEGGADAVYLGGLGFNARMNATNFTEDDLREGIARAHAFGVEVYLTMNTLLLDRERDDYLRAAEYACRMGADALIVEVHNDPQRALCDGAQSLTPQMFDGMMKKVAAVRPHAWTKG